MSLTIKICGLNDRSSLDAALNGGADMVGFVFFARSPRHVSLAAARALGARVEGRARKVALTVDGDDATLAAIVAALAPDLLQLHGRETPARVAAVRARFDLPIIRALAIAEWADLDQISEFEEVADYLLFDARAPAQADRPGGNGMAFDWSLLKGIRPTRPWLLAGGLTAANVAQALEATGATGLDVSSGVETAPGRKDPALVAEFLAVARGAVSARA